MAGTGFKVFFFLRHSTTNTKKIKSLVKKHKVNLGISLDGDADRIILTDEKANIVDGDKIIAVLAERWKRKKPINISF